MYETPSTVKHPCPSDPSRTQTHRMWVHDPFADFKLLYETILCVYDAVCRVCLLFTYYHTIYAD